MQLERLCNLCTHATYADMHVRRTCTLTSQLQAISCKYDKVVHSRKKNATKSVFTTLAIASLTQQRGAGLKTSQQYSSCEKSFLQCKVFKIIAFENVNQIIFSKSIQSVGLDNFNKKNETDCPRF